MQRNDRDMLPQRCQTLHQNINDDYDDDENNDIVVCFSYKMARLQSHPAGHPQIIKTYEYDPPISTLWR